MQSNISITMISSEEVNIENLASDWLLLESKSNCSFYLTWAWIGFWLEQVSLPFFVLKGTQGTNIVALSIIFKKTRKVLGFIPIEQWWINRTGQEAYDQCWIEENDFLIYSSQRLLIRNAIVEFLKKEPSWRELILGMSHSKTLDALSSISPEKIIMLDDKGYGVKYSEIDNTYEQDVLSRNTRQKIRQSEKLLLVEGELSFHVYTSEAEKNLCFDDIVKLHVARWQNTATPSGFNNQYFKSMLFKLISQPSVEISCVQLNKIAVAYLININYNNKIYFYLSALKPMTNPKIKLGMLIQQKAVEYYKKLGFEYYDFLAGEARYKSSLSNDSYTQQMRCFHRTSLLHKIEKSLKIIKNKYLN